MIFDEASLHTALVSLESLQHAADFCLASASIAGDEGAQKAIAQLASSAFAHLRKRSMDAFEDEVQQRVLVHLFGVGEDDGRLSSYRAKGALHSWLRVVVTRLALNALRDHQTAQRGWVESDEDFPGAESDPELMLLKLQDRAGFKAAFANAVSKLDDRERLLLKLRFSDQLQQDQIAQVMRSHRVTVANWLKDVQQKLQRSLSDELRSAAGVALEEAHLLDDWMQTNPDLSLSRLFAGKNSSLL